MKKYLLVAILILLPFCKNTFARVVLTEVISMTETATTYTGTSSITSTLYTVAGSTKLMKNFEFCSALITFRGTNTAGLRWVVDGSTPVDASHDIEALVLNNYLDIVNFKAVLTNDVETDVGTLTISYSVSDKDNN